MEKLVNSFKEMQKIREKNNWQVYDKNIGSFLEKIKTTDNLNLLRAFPGAKVFSFSAKDIKSDIVYLFKVLDEKTIEIYHIDDDGETVYMADDQKSNFIIDDVEDSQFDFYGNRRINKKSNSNVSAFSKKETPSSLLGRHRPFRDDKLLPLAAHIDVNNLDAYLEDN